MTSVAYREWLSEIAIMAFNNNAQLCPRLSLWKSKWI